MRNSSRIRYDALGVRSAVAAPLPQETALFAWRAVSVGRDAGAGHDTNVAHKLCAAAHLV